MAFSRRSARPWPGDRAARGLREREPALLRNGRAARLLVRPLHLQDRGAAGRQGPPKRFRVLLSAAPALTAPSHAIVVTLIAALRGAKGSPGHKRKESGPTLAFCVFAGRVGVPLARAPQRRLRAAGARAAAEPARPKCKPQVQAHGEVYAAAVLGLRARRHEEVIVR